MEAQKTFYEQLERQYDDCRQRLQGLKQELSSYEKIMSLLNDHINENLSVQKRLKTNNEDDKKQAIVKESYKKLVTKYERFKIAKMDREDEYKKVLAEKNLSETNLNSMKAQLREFQAQKAQRVEEQQQLQQQQQQQQSENRGQQQTVGPIFNYDVETINFLNEDNWNVGESCDRHFAESTLACFPNGTFLVRSSRSKKDSFVLSVVANSKVKHCLIDKIQTDEGKHQYCFHPPGPTHQFYPDLTELVMDYRHKSLVCHNPELDTNLIYPVISQLKKNKKQNPTETNDGQLKHVT